MEQIILVPSVHCKHGWLECPLIVLPFPNLKTVTTYDEFETEQEATPEGETHPLDWPPDGWKAWFVCSECGFVSEYLWWEVGWLEVPKSAPGKFHSSIDCFCIEFLCGQKNCKAPTKLHIQRNRLDEAGVRGLLSEPFFIGSLPCGHDFPSLPLSEYKIHKVIGPIG